jgi:hypothetical protein
MVEASRYRSSTPPGILVLVAFDGLTLSYYQEFRFDTLSAARVSCLLGMA